MNTIVNRDGVVCAVAFSGGDRGAQWPGSRAISAQKANTANSFSLDGLALYSGGEVIGTVGVSGAAARPDNIIYDIAPNPTGGTGISAGGFGHTECLNTGDETTLPAVQL